MRLTIDPPLLALCCVLGITSCGQSQQGAQPPGSVPTPAGVVLDFPRPSLDACRALRPSRWAPARGHADPAGTLRVVGLQYKQEVRHVETYAAFRTKMRCLMEEHAVPLMRPGLTMLVVYNEDIGLMTLATGSRGASVRAQAESPAAGPGGDGAPGGIAGALGQINAAYSPQVAAYQSMFGPIDPRKQVFVAATDTFARAYSQTFSDIARDYGVFVVATNNQALYRASTDPVDIATFGDPDLENISEVYIATGQTVTNQTHLWGPDDLHPNAPAGETNLIFRNHKVPITQVERDLIALDEGPATGQAALDNARGAVVGDFQLGFATSLPAFRWGYDFGQPPPDDDPCADVRVSYMPCMDQLGVNVVIQAEANPGRWAVYTPLAWQPLEWMNSTWRSVTDPHVDFAYNVTPHMVGNLLDLVFDGQSAITRRGASAPAQQYIGNGMVDADRDAAIYHQYAGPKPEFLVLADWVVGDTDRATLADTSARLATGSGDPLENDYLETAVWADLAPPEAQHD